MSTLFALSTRVLLFSACVALLPVAGHQALGQRTKPPAAKPAAATADPTEAAPVPVTSLKPEWATRLAEVRKTQPQGLVVLEAKWIQNGKGNDVTELLQSMVEGDSLTAFATSEALRGGGGPGWQLRMTYVDGDEAKLMVVSDGQPLQIGPTVTSFSRMGLGLQNLNKTVEALRKKIPTGLLVLDARFGERQENDVTSICQELVSGDSLTVPATEEGLRTAGSHGFAKLKVTYFDGKEMKSETVSENYSMQIGPKVTSYVRKGQGAKNLDKTLAEFRKSHPNDILVLNAIFGKDNGWTDVTDICQSLVSGESITVPVHSDTFKLQGDNWSALTITYYANDEVKVETVRDGASVQVGPERTAFVRAGQGVQNLQKALAALRVKHPTGLVVLQARWANSDETEFCQTAVSEDSLTMPITKEAFNEEGGPFDIDYNDGTSTKSAHLTGGVLQVGPKTTSFLKPEGGLGLVADTLKERMPSAGNGLIILNARFGNEGRWSDVRDILQKQVVANTLHAKVGENWPDPWPGATLHAEITYWDGAQAKSVSFANGATIEIGAVPNPPRTVASAAASPSTQAAAPLSVPFLGDDVIAVHPYGSAIVALVIGALGGLVIGRLRKSKPAGA